MELTLADFVFYVVLGSGLVVLILSFFSRTMHARSEARALKNRVICRLCLHAFVESTNEKVVACPRCGAATEKGRSRQLG